MRSVGPAGPVVAGLFLLLPAAARAQGLDNDDTSFLNDVRPLILPEEKATFEKLGDKADRLEFRKIFWARRDRDLATPENEFRLQYVKDREIADRRYSVPGTVGSVTDCGRLFILLGKPDEIERDTSPTLVVRDNEIVSRLSGPSYSLSGTVRRAETWVYKDRPDRRLPNGRAAITFDEECRGGR
jgi:GWxTD domain-containing protein